MQHGLVIRNPEDRGLCTSCVQVARKCAILTTEHFAHRGDQVTSQEMHNPDYRVICAHR